MAILLFQMGLLYQHGGWFSMFHVKLFNGGEAARFGQIDEIPLRENWKGETCSSHFARKDHACRSEILRFAQEDRGVEFWFSSVILRKEATKNLLSERHKEAKGRPWERIGRPQE